VALGEPPPSPIPIALFRVRGICMMCCELQDTIGVTLSLQQHQQESVIKTLFSEPGANWHLPHL
jgi:hypothetical protein